MKRVELARANISKGLSNWNKAKGNVVVVTNVITNDQYTYNSLSEAARALKCKFVYKLVPEEPLEQIIEKQLAKKAKESVAYLSHHMDLENQKTSSGYLSAQEVMQIQNLRSGKLSKIWN